MDKYVKLSAIEQMAKPMGALHGKGANAGYKEPATEAADMEEDTAEGEYSSWECPKCDTSVQPSRHMTSMKCPCCEADMEEQD